MSESKTSFSKPTSDSLVMADEEEEENAMHATSSSSALNKGLQWYGFLRKSATQKTLAKRRRCFFVYAENTCKLYYFRSEDRNKPSGEIDIGGATFSLEVDHPGCHGLIRISTPEHSIELEANDRTTALYWLQELQKRRRKFSKKRTANIKKYGVSAIPIAGQVEGGLMKSQALEDEESSDENIPNLVSPEVEPPEGFFDIEYRKTSHSNTPNLFLSNIRSQIRHGIVNIKTGRSHEATSMSSSTDESFAGSPSSPVSPLTSPHQVEHKIFAKATKRRSSSFRYSLPFPFASKESSPTPENGCKKCDKLANEIVQLQDCLIHLNTDLKSSKQLVQFLQQQLDLACRQKESVMRIQSNPNAECHMKLALEKDFEILQLNDKLDEMRSELDDVRLQYTALKKEANEMQSYDEDVLKLKNQVIDHLTEQVANLEVEKNSSKCDDWVVLRHPQPHTLDFVSSPTQAAPNYSEMEKLKDELEAFHIQNRFLNSEILQLNLLRKDAEERETFIKTKCVEWEAKYYAIQSKYMVLLNEYHSPTAAGVDKANETASRLLSDAISDSGGPDYISIAKVISRDSPYDVYGFSKTSAVPTFSLLQSACLMKQRSEDISGRLKDSYAEVWISKWESYMSGFSRRNFQTSPTLKELIRTGIPFIHRSAIWKGCVDMYVKNTKDKKPRNYYESLLSNFKHGSVINMASKQIELDLLRTLPHNRHFENAHSSGVPKLRRVLLAFSRHNPVVGYCQGLNRLAAIALLFLSEEDAFWCLTAIVEQLIPPDYYTTDLIGAQVDQMVLKDLLVEKFPRLHAHFERNAMDISLFTFSWCMCLFVDCVPIETYLYIWDAVLHEGDKILFRFALAIFKICEEECLKADDSMSISRALRDTAENLMDWRRLSHIAFNDLNPFPRRTIANKREQYLVVVKQEVEKINLQREAIRTLSRASHESVSAETLSSNHRR